MYEFLATDPEVAEQRQEAYAPIDIETAYILADVLDGFIEERHVPRTAQVTEEMIVERIEHTALLADMNINGGFAWPLTQLRLNLRRQCFFDDQVAGNVYMLVMEWMVQRGDLDDAGYATAYKLFLPEESNEIEPSLSYYHVPSVLLLEGQGGVIAPEDFVSGHYEADQLLNSVYYKYWNQAREFDAECLFNDLLLIDNSLRVASETPHQL